MPMNTKRIKFYDRDLPLGERTLIMGILNITPDSFSDGGKFTKAATAVVQAVRMAEEGADIIDIGGESTRPGSTAVDEEEELRRVLPVIRAIREHVSIPLSIDTYKSAVAEQAIAEGVHMINDVWGGKADRDMLPLAARKNVPVCLMHNKQKALYGHNPVMEIVTELEGCVTAALQAGIEADNIIIDPGVGFGKTLQHNLEVMHHLSEFRELGYPVLLGTSRKSLIGKVLDLPADDRREGTAATVALGIAAGVDIVRVHDVKEMRRVAVMTDAIVRRP